MTQKFLREVLPGCTTAAGQHNLNHPAMKYFSTRGNDQELSFEEVNLIPIP